MKNLLAPKLPEMDLEAWRRRPYRERIEVMNKHWVENGFGTPVVMYFVYVFKMAAYLIGGFAIIAATTPGIGGLSEFGSWWSEPVVFQKFVLWTLLYEVIGLGCGSGSLTFHFFPPVGAFLHWLRPGTIRLPAWPDKVPFTSGDRRTVFDVGLYAALLVLGFRALLAPELTPALLAAPVVLLPIIGLRDKPIFLAARAEQYWTMLIVFLFAGDVIAGSKAIMLAVWWGAATSKLNHHFPAVVAVMMSNSPFMRSKRVKRAMYQNYPTDLRPSRWAALLAHGGTAIEYSVPLLLALSSGGTLTAIGLAVMVVFHLHIISTFPMGVPLEWNIFVIYGALLLFGVHADVSILSISSPLLAAFLLVTLVGLPLLGNFKPHLLSFLVSMRYYAGNWATSMWLFRPEAYEKVDETIVKSAKVVEKQLALFYDELTAQALMHKAQGWRSMHVSGRALTGLLPRAVDNLEDYVIHDGEWTAGVLIGWNFGEGHFHHEQLIEAVQSRCNLDPGDLRVIILESQPIHQQHQHWRIHDAAEGKLDEGYVDIAELRSRQPWLDGDGWLPVRSLMHPERPTPHWPTGPTSSRDEEATRIPEPTSDVDEQPLTKPAPS